MTLAKRLSAWMKFLRVVNLPTIPGDVLCGAAAGLFWRDGMRFRAEDRAAVAFAIAASCCLYLFGLADNDIAGAETDAGRPIPDGEISMRAARTARAALLAFGIAFAALSGLAQLDGCAVFAVATAALAALLAAAIAAYNRTKKPILMGLCRGLDVLVGVAAVAMPLFWLRLAVRAPLAATAAVAAVAAVWTVYVAAVTKYSEGEEENPVRRRRVGILVGGIVVLQSVALLAFAALGVAPYALAAAAAAIPVALVIVRLAFPSVSAS